MSVLLALFISLFLLPESSQAIIWLSERKRVEDQVTVSTHINLKQLHIV